MSVFADAPDSDRGFHFDRGFLSGVTLARGFADSPAQVIIVCL